MPSSFKLILPISKLITFSIILLANLHPILTLNSCRNRCGTIAINYPFGIDTGCGAPQYQKMLNCSTSTDLFFQTPSGTYKVQAIDYSKKTLTIYDPSMSTCSILQPHHDFVMSDIQSVIIPPSPDTVFALMNCSIDSPVLNHYRNLCFNFSGHSCDELYGACTSFRLFHLSTNSSPPCCFTRYNTVRVMSMNILDCTHYTSMYNVDELKGVGPLDWVYGIKLSFSVPDTGCDRCETSGGTCGFDVDTEGMVCICSSTVNSTTECAAGTMTSRTGRMHTPFSLIQAFIWLLGAGFYVIL